MALSLITIIKVEVETLMVELTTRPKAELLMSIKAEAEGRSLKGGGSP